MLETIFFKIQFDQSTSNFDKCKIITVFEFSSTIFCFNNSSLPQLSQRLILFCRGKLACSEQMANHALLIRTKCYNAA